MKKYSIEIDDREPIKFTCPESWEEVTVGQYIKMESEDWQGDDVIKLLSILSGETLQELDNLKDVKQLTDALEELTKFTMNKPPEWDKLKGSKYIVLGGKKLIVPTDIEGKRLGQKIMLSQIMRGGDLVKMIPQAMAIYFQPEYDNSNFNRDRLPKIEQLINEMPIVEAYPVVRFFFRMLREQKLNGTTF